MSASAPDGSPVGLATLTPLGEPELIRSRLRGRRDLQLGCGAGRITHELIALGHGVTAVDNSAEMLAHVRGAGAVRADIRSADLGRTFPVVLLASNFLNAPAQEELDAVLATAYARRRVRRPGAARADAARLAAQPGDEDGGRDRDDAPRCRARRRDHLGGDGVPGEAASAGHTRSARS